MNTENINLCATASVSDHATVINMNELIIPALMEERNHAREMMMHLADIDEIMYNEWEHDALAITKAIATWQTRRTDYLMSKNVDTESTKA